VAGGNSRELDRRMPEGRVAGGESAGRGGEDGRAITHLIDYKWQLHLFALGVVNTDERHFAKACASQFIEVAQEWEIADKITTCRASYYVLRGAHRRSRPCLRLTPLAANVTV